MLTKAIAWLKRSLSASGSGCSDGGEIVDVISLKAAEREENNVVEVKGNRRPFLRDEKPSFRKEPGAKCPDPMTLFDFFQHCRRPLYYKGKLNSLRNQELLSLGGIRQAASFGPAYGQAYLQKLTKGRYQFQALWTLESKSSRADIWTQGYFTLKKGVMTFDEHTSPESIHAFFMVCRYLAVFIRVEAARYKESYQVNNARHSWYRYFGISVLFCGEILSGCRLIRRHHRKDLTEYERDRIVTNPILAFMRKQKDQHHGHGIELNGAA